MQQQTLILASASPRRKEILQLADIAFEVVPSHVEETHPPGLAPEAIPEAIALRKAREIRKNMPDRTILAADTVVLLNNRIFEKPAGETEAIEMLKILSGKTHTVVTGVCILHGENTICFSEQTRVTFHELTEADLTYYVQKYRPLDKAGSYAVQEWIGAVGIRSIEGDYFNVVGLPMQRVFAALRQCGFLK